MTESVSPYTTREPGTIFRTSSDVRRIIARPVAVTAAATGRHGRKPLDAPRKPYTLLAETLYASCLPLASAAPKASPRALAAAMSRFAAVRNCASCSRSPGTTESTRSPSRVCAKVCTPMPVSTV